MPKDKLTDYSATNASNTDVGGVNIDEGMLPSAVNNSIRELMTHLKNFSDGTDAITGLTVDGNIKLDGNYPTGTNNVALGDAALDDGSLSGNSNTALGSGALTANTSASNNTAVGKSALAANTTGTENVAVGMNAFDGNTTASYGTAVGYGALSGANTGASNTAIGHSALLVNTSGEQNVAVGMEAMQSNTTGNYNTVVGRDAMEANTTGSQNTAVGWQALLANTTAGSNTGIGYRTGRATTTGQWNVFVGDSAGDDNTTGFGNTFVGTSYAGGAGALVTTGNRNTFIGGYNGNSNSLDLRTAVNFIVLSDGDGVPAMYRTGGGVWHFNSSRSGGGGAETFQFKCSGSNPQGLRVQFTNAADDDNNEDFFRCIDTATTRLIITNQGDVQNHDNAYGATSDQKLKEQITDASSQWDDIKALTVRKYKMKLDVTEKGDSDALWRLGVVAQEVEAAGMSGLITENIDRDDDGNDLGTRTKVVKYSVLYMKAVKALQEAMTRIETLETKVAALEAE